MGSLLVAVKNEPIDQRSEFVEALRHGFRDDEPGSATRLSGHCPDGTFTTVLIQASGRNEARG